MLNRILNTVSATWIFVIIFYVYRVYDKNECSIKIMHESGYYIFNILFLIIGTLVMVFIPIYITEHKITDNLDKAKLIELADNSFLPSYLGYFFVAISIDNVSTMEIFYAIIFIFTFVSGVEYFNPIFLIMGYHIYKIESDTGVQNIIILKSKSVIRNSEEISNLKLYRINNLTYIGRK